MKKAKEKKSSGWLHLDPRSKLLILVLFSVVVMIDVVDGPAYTVRVIMTFIPVALRRCGDAYPFSLLYGDTIRPYDDYGMVLHINYKDQ